MNREVERLVRGQATSDGAGVQLTRVLTQDLQQRLDPFLMLDVFASDNPDDYIAGFPEHPHRGFETITYMLAGKMRHKDSAGNEGVLGPGDVQWMTAGSGILHSEMPEQIDGRMEGFQLWLNLPAKSKMTEPSYADTVADEIPAAVADNGIRFKLIAGQLVADNIQGAMAGAIQRVDTEPLFVDIHFERSASAQIDVPSGHRAFIFVYRGSVTVDGSSATAVPAGNMGILSEGDALSISGEAQSKAILVAGKPLNEPIAQHGPFVMNTRDELIQAVEDLRSGNLVR